MSEFLNLTESAVYANVSYRTISRLIAKLKESKSKDFKAELVGKKKVYYIKKSFLESHYGISTTDEFREQQTTLDEHIKDSKSSKVGEKEEPTVVSSLMERIKSLESQLEKKDLQIERLQILQLEQHNLLKSKMLEAPIPSTSQEKNKDDSNVGVIVEDIAKTQKKKTSEKRIETKSNNVKGKDKKKKEKQSSFKRIMSFLNS